MNLSKTVIFALRDYVSFEETLVRDPLLQAASYIAYARDVVGRSSATHSVSQLSLDKSRIGIFFFMMIECKNRNSYAILPFITRNAPYAFVTR